MANRSRLTFARVCVQISKNSPLPEEIPIQIEWEDINLKVVYDWNPSPCEGCSSLIHPFSSCPANPNPQHFPLPPSKPRGRSFSRKPFNRGKNSTSRPPTLPPILKPTITLDALLDPSSILAPAVTDK
ncbi:hypothetical protein KFK09_028603 [Dendrobium nobile]|uniref:Zinc knuckle CX2CX4HX4C domain-containing protein n=1 Tax=Dendrobium nobile TaxID=94219 RepID=A0A8T3A2D3_DENNO|nr:hypothetical protein KFK09_028603 [Dendrobium nobile]